MSAPCNDPAILSSVLRSAVKETGKTEILDRANLSNQKREPLMKYASLTRAICLAAILFVAGCNGQVIESPITTQSGLAFMSSKRISAGDLSNQDASLSERSEENAASDPVQPEAMDDCPVNRLENLDIEGI